jgi:hypothetical protein
MTITLGPGRHPGTAHIASLLEAGQHLPPKLKHITELYENLAQHLVDDLKDGPELTVALRDLLTSKDAAVRQRVLDLKAEGTPPPANTPEPELRGGA